MNALTEAMFLANEVASVYAYTAVRPISRWVAPYRVRRVSDRVASFMICFSSTIVGAEDA
jgi:hypothetical protein